jgi:trigger factor
MANIYADYKNNHLGKEQVTPVTEEELQKELEDMLKQHVHAHTKEGVAESGNVVNIDFEGFLDGVAFEGGKGEHFDLELGSNTFIPGFEDQLIGHAAGEDVFVHVTFPEQYQAANLAGKAVVFKCHIHEVKAKHEPELNDEFAKHMGLENVEALKAAVKNNMEKGRQAEIDNAYLEKLLRHIVTASTIEATEEETASAKAKIIDYYTRSVAQYGMTLEAYIQAVGMDKTKFDLSIAEEAENTARTSILSKYIAEKEGLAATEAEFNAQLNSMKEYYRLTDDKINEIASAHREELMEDVTKEKVARFLLANND